jgi:hypothetical protein
MRIPMALCPLVPSHKAYLPYTLPKVCAMGPKIMKTWTIPVRIPLFTTPQSKQSSKGGLFLFSWAHPCSRTKSKPSLPVSSAPVLTLPRADSFSLKSFRHFTPFASETPPSDSPSEKGHLPPPARMETALPATRYNPFPSRLSGKLRGAAARQIHPPHPCLAIATPGQVRKCRRSALAHPPSVTKVGSQSRLPTRSRPEWALGLRTVRYRLRWLMVQYRCFDCHLTMEGCQLLLEGADLYICEGKPKRIFIIKLHRM